jgi:hypothetical protein
MPLKPRGKGLAQLTVVVIAASSLTTAIGRTAEPSPNRDVTVVRVEIVTDNGLTTK